MSEMVKSSLQNEIDSWEGFVRVMRKEDRVLWEEAVLELKSGFEEAVEKSGRLLTVEPFFMSLLIAQQKTIVELRRRVEHLKEKQPHESVRPEEGTPH
jgi:hypothetical protein